MRWSLVTLLAGLMLLASCSPLYEPPENLVDLEQLPASYGELVDVTQYKDTHWYELWFYNEETGAITHVPLYRSTWQVRPERVRTILRDGPMVSGEDQP